MASDLAIFFDGKTSARRAVDVSLDENDIAVREHGAIIAVWRYGDLRRADGPTGVLRLSNINADELARLEISDVSMVAAIEARARNIDDTPHSRISARRVVFWSMAAALSVIGIAIFGVPLAADRLAPLVPVSFEKRLGAAVDGQVKSIFGGDVCKGAAGNAALTKLIAQLNAQIPTPLPLQPAALSSSVPNAVALPGGRIYVFDGLLQKADSPDELAGVLAHEVAHVANRDGMRRVIQVGGTSFLIGMLFGDVTGSSVMITLGNELLNASYSREAESRADAGAIKALHGLGRSSAGLGELLMRITGQQRSGAIDFLKSHPLTEDRLAAMRAADRPATGAQLLTPEEWTALKGVCKPS